MKKKTGLNQSVKKSSDKVPVERSSSAFPVVGIGASAGGLETLEVFLKHVPVPCGIAFVIVQHLDPTHKGILVELLQRVTSMPVAQVTDRQKIEPDHIYVIPPNQDMTVLHGTLHLLDMVTPRGLRLPIDLFFRSMADDMQHRAIGVILSGMGSDGTLGLRAIKEQGGGVFVQDPATSKFDGMPRSAIDDGLADVVAPVEELPGKIFAYLKHAPIAVKPNIATDSRSRSSLEKVLILLRTQTGHDFSFYKKNTVYRRIERRMGIHQIEKIADYVRFLQENPHEIDLLFKELLIGVTSFFRDPATWEILKEKAIPSILSARPAGGLIRAWVAGCSTGEEAYSLAMVFREVIATLKPAGAYKLQIFATDLDRDAIDKARTGMYPLNISADVSPERLKRFFDKDERGFHVTREIRETIVFAPHNVIMDPPFTKLDILVCRNLLIYMEPELQKKVLTLFHYSLNPGGLLFLGSAETVGPNGNQFETIDTQSRIFRQLHQGIRTTAIDFPASFAVPASQLPDLSPVPLKITGSELNLQQLTSQFLLQHFTSAAVLTNDQGDIIFISGRTGKYLEPAAGKANLNVFAMAREGLRYELSLLFSSALRNKKEMTKKGLAVGTNGGRQIIDLTVKLVDMPDSLRGTVLIIFTDIVEQQTSTGIAKASPKASSDARLIRLEDELRQAKDEISTIHEEMQTSQEELKSTNEEMQSANEELQSTNEELTTSKEEMQSLNEELQTVNQELQSKVSDLSQANNDMKNLLNSTDIATLFLDNELNVRRYTTRTATLIKLIPSDIGRPITDIVTNLDYPALAADARQVLHELIFSEKQVSTNDGRWFTVKIMPYRTMENRIDGLVITFTDITIAKQFERGLLQSEQTCRFLLSATPLGAWLQDSDGKIVMANPEAERITGIPVKELCGRSVAELRWKLFRQDGSELPPAEHPAMIVYRTGKPVRDLLLRLELPFGTAPKWIRFTATPHALDGSGNAGQVYTTFAEVDAPR